MIRVLDKDFEKYIEAEKIQERVKALAIKMNEEISDLNPVFLAVLNGSFFFAADLLKEINFPCEVSFVKVTSYRGTQTTGILNTLIGLDEDLSGRHVVVLEDIVDTGLTMSEVIRLLEEKKAASIRVAALIFKREALRMEVPLNYIGFEVPDEFLIGYGLDYDKQGRNYKDIYRVKAE